MRKELVKRIKRTGVLASISFAISVVFFITGQYRNFELKAYDLMSAYLNPPRASDRILIVQIDQSSIDALSKEGVTWPWPRQMYAPVVEFFKDADAFFIDMLFTEQSSYGLEDDTILAEKIKEASNVYLPVALTSDNRPISLEDREFFKLLDLGGPLTPSYVYPSAITPIDVLKKTVRGGGNVTIDPDGDGIYRRVPLAFKVDHYTLGHFMVEYLLRKGLTSVKDGRFYASGKKIPLTGGALLLKYYSTGKPFKTVSFASVLKEALYGPGAVPHSVKQNGLKGKIVILGTTAAGLYDLKPTPVSSVSNGALINATLLDNMLNGNFIRLVPAWTTVVLMFLLSLSVTYVFTGRRYLLANVLFLIIFMGLALALCTVFFKYGLATAAIAPQLTLISGFIVSLTHNYATEGKERRFIKNTFSRYVDKTIVDYLLDHPHMIAPGGQKKWVTVFFADIAGFTSISEKLSPEDTAKMLHGVLNAFTEIVIANGGVVDKYIGDCIMAFWGSPFSTAEDETNACRTALECLNALVGDINPGFVASGIPTINVRVGIHSGEAIAGNMGSDRLFAYTVIGDTVNLSSRLESVNKVFKTNIIISEDTYKRTGETFLCRQLGLIEVKGKEIPVRIYELMDGKSLMAPEKVRLKELYDKAMDGFYERRFNEAIQIFSDILRDYPQDGPTLFNKTRCENLLTAPDILTNKWETIKMEVK